MVRSAVGSGVDGSENYGVAFMDVYSGETKIRVLNDLAGDVIDGCFITNTAWVKHAIINGDGYADQPGGFMCGDSLAIWATGMNGADETATVRFLLGDYRASSETDHYYLDSWQWFDLRPLGKVTDVKFTVTGTKSNSWGLSTPTYFCMDDFNGIRPETLADMLTLTQDDSVLNLDDYFSFDDDQASVAYRLADEYDASVLSAQVAGNWLTLSGNTIGTTDLVVSATQKGKTQYQRLPVNVQSVSSLASSRSDSYGVAYADGKLNVYSSGSNASFELHSLSGSVVKRTDLSEGVNVISVESLDRGIYLVTINDTAQRVIQKIFIR